MRLTCSQNDRPLSLKAGESFGELTLFPEESFESYSAKASRDALKLCFISGDSFLTLSRQYHISRSPAAPRASTYSARRSRRVPEIIPLPGIFATVPGCDAQRFLE